MAESGDIGDADLVRLRQQQGAGEAETPVDGQGAREPCQTARANEDGGEETSGSRSKELVRAADLIVRADDDELREAGLVAVSSLSYRSWSGRLPEPDEFNKYDKDTQERICRWNDAFTVDESARQDRLVDNEIKQQNRGVILTFILMWGFIVAAFASFLVTRHAASFGFLCVPIVNSLGNLLKPVFSRSSRSPQDEEGGTTG